MAYRETYGGFFTVSFQKFIFMIRLPLQYIQDTGLLGYFRQIYEARQL